MKPEDRKKIYDYGVLDPAKHDRFIDELHNLTKVAGIYHCQDMVYKPFKEFHEVESQYLRKLKLLAKEEGIHGLVYMDMANDFVLKRMQEVTGMLVRNEIDARFMLRSEALSKLRYEGEVRATALLIPNFCPDQILKNGKPVDVLKKNDFTEMQKEQIYDLLLKKFQAGSQVIISADSFEAIEAAYGKGVLSHIQSHFIEVRNGSGS